MGLVYLILNSETDRYKIGVTSNDTVKKRFNNIKTGNDCGLMLISTFKTKHHRKLERMLHVRFSNKRYSGEWFELTIEDVSNFKNTCTEILEIIEGLDQNPFF